MGLIGGALGYRILRTIAPGGSGGSRMDGSAYAGRSKLEVLFGPSLWEEIHGKVVIDFGCGTGAEAVELAGRGAAHVIGVDIQEHLLQHARFRAEQAGVADRCSFVTSAGREADLIVSLDTFEHFADPAAILDIMHRLVKPGGVVLASFGPTWYHPLGGHLFSVFPWAHLIFTERSLIRWRSDFKDDGARTFDEVAGGLNRMTLARFERIVAASRFRFASFEAVPIRQLAPLANRLTREWTTAIVRCRLVPLP